MTAPDHLKITGPEDILGFIPHSLGYWPANSLVAMTLQGKRLGATLRVDLPEPSRCRGPALAAFARTVRDYLEADEEADGALLAIFSAPEGAADDGAEGDTADDGGPDAGGGVPDGDIAPSLARLLAELERTLGAAGLPVRDAWLIGARYWRNAHCTDPSCCAPPGRPIEEIRNSRLNAELVFRGSSVGAAPGRSARGRPAAGGTPAPDEPAALEAEQGWAREFSGRWRNRAQFHAVLEVWERVLESANRPAGNTAGRQSAGVPAAALQAGLAGYLRATLCVAPWRDAVLVMAAAGRAAAEAGAEKFGVFDAGPDEAAPLPELDGFPVAAPAPGPAPGEAPTAGETPGYGDVLLGLLPPAPDWARLAGLDRVLVFLGGCGGGEAKAAALTGRGWIEWCRGRGSFADALFSAADAEQPGYRLAELLAELGRRGTLCGWARRRDAAWQKFDPDAA
ncbi:DUF4192 family protein [Arthrobacter sp. UKPF54-2]|uniref:DUF4192 family protein n=1 Tax=Arthrobacter sp. UKPF54-2 TaxID=2600159 RepID=UPI0011B18DDA|nr:DUF4192 family protein [Arthrobacter sp. UKPF54-2]QDY91369.1 DUF4192 family protein [Arthrobacter sp. UKPF54-2]